MSLLRAEGLSAGYGETMIVQCADLRVEPLEIVTIAGTNGSGKSTLVKAVMGLVPRVTGTLAFDGADLLRLPPEKRVGVGMSYVPQVANVFASLSVLENLQVMEGVADRKARISEMFELFPALAERRRMAAGRLSGGERQQLAFARALMPRPKLMVLDEPTAALSPKLVDLVLELTKRLPGLGVTVLLVEQRVRQALAISDRGYILDSGRIVLTDRAAALLSNEDMARLYLGDI
ncbi:MAG TPA: ABC transporter ATP-binding protein [Azospirillum sp.]|nr:ABC transporter ATP-binding protein [Azospirillum sp.]